MSVKYRKWLAAALLALIPMTLAAAPRTYAQDSLTLSELSIQMWPEFDDASMLVFYIGQVDGVTDSVDVTFTLPPGAAVNATAYNDTTTGNLLTAPSNVNGDQVTITSPNGSFHLEFYDPSLNTSSDQRTYSLDWPGTYAVKSLEWIVQEPPTAQNMTITPLAVSPQAGQFGLAYYGATQTDLAAGQAETLVVTYTKSDSLLTASSVLPAAQNADVAPSIGSSAPSPAASSVETRTVLIAVLVIVGIGAIGGGLYLYNRSQEEQPAQRQPRQRGGRKPTRAARTAGRSGGTGRQFCTQCGTPVVDASDKFCRNCGASLSG